MILNYPKLHATLLCPPAHTIKYVACIHFANWPSSSSKLFFPNLCILLYNFPESLFVPFLFLLFLWKQPSGCVIGFAPSHPGHGDRQPWMDTFACLWWWLPGGCCCHFSESVHSSCRMSWRILSPVTTAVTAPQARLIWLCVLCSEPRLLPLCLRTRNVYHSVGVTHVL